MEVSRYGILEMDIKLSAKLKRHIKENMMKEYYVYRPIRDYLSSQLEEQIQILISMNYMFDQDYNVFLF